MQTNIEILVRNVVEDINDELQYESLKNPGPETELFGGNEGLDSLSLVSLIIQLEASISESFGKTVTLVDDKAMSMRNSPFRTLGTLTAFVTERLENAS